MNANQTKYGLIKAVNFTTDQWDHDQGKKWYRNIFINNKRKTVVAERFIRTLENKIYKQY